MRPSKRWVGYAVTAAIGALVAAGVLASRGFWALTEPAAIYGALSDAFFVPGIILLSFGLLVFVSNNGFFDIFAYARHSLVVLFTPFRKPEDHERYFEYKLAREERRRKPKPFLLHVGLAYTVLAGFCLVLYMTQA